MEAKESVVIDLGCRSLAGLESPIDYSLNRYFVESLFISFFKLGTVRMNNAIA
jgi:hypothetical protein